MKRSMIVAVVSLAALALAASAQAAAADPPTVSCHVNRGWQGYFSDLTVRAQRTVHFRWGRYHVSVPRCQVAYAVAAEISDASGWNPLHLNSYGDGHIHIWENGRDGFDGRDWHVHVDREENELPSVTATQGHLRVQYYDQTTSVWGIE